MITKGWIDPKNTQLELYAHTFDNDNNIRNLTMRYELECFMLDGSKEHRLIDDFDLMPFKVVPGIVGNMNHFIFTPKKRYFIPDIQPNYKNMFKMGIRTKRTSQNPSNLNNESMYTRSSNNSHKDDETYQRYHDCQHVVKVSKITTEFLSGVIKILVQRSKYNIKPGTKSMGVFTCASVNHNI